ncbi:MAG: hypothetical protein ACLRM9_05740 [Collinsella aerofaciens]
MTAISGNDPAKEAESLTRLIDAGVDGLVVNTCGGNDEAIAAAADVYPSCCSTAMLLTAVLTW